MTDRIEERIIETHGDHIHEEQIVYDLAADKRRMAYQVSSLVWVLFGILIGAIALRILLKLIAANPANPFAALVFATTDLFMWPFLGLTISPSAGEMVLEIPAIVAVLVYARVGWAFVQIVWLILYRA